MEELADCLARHGAVDVIERLLSDYQWSSLEDMANSFDDQLPRLAVQWHTPRAGCPFLLRCTLSLTPRWRLRGL